MRPVAPKWDKSGFADDDGRAHRGARLMSWFNEKFYEEATHPLVTERIYKRFMSERMAAAHRPQT